MRDVATTRSSALQKCNVKVLDPLTRNLAISTLHAIQFISPFNMKTPPSFRQNRFVSTVRFTIAGTLISAATAMAFFAGSGRLASVSNPSSQLSQDRPATIKIPGEWEAIFNGFRSARAMPGEGPAGGYEAYKSAARTYPANVIPPSLVRNAKNTFNRIAVQGDPGNNNHWQAYGPIQHSIQPGVLSFSGATTPTASRDPVLVIAPTCVPGNCRLWVGTGGSGVWGACGARGRQRARGWIRPVRG